MRKSHGLILQAINGNIHYKIFFYYWSSFFLALCICSPTRGSMQTMNKNYKDGLQLKIFDLQAPKKEKRKKKKEKRKDLLAPLPKRRNWYHGAQIVKPSHAFWWWMGNWFHEPFLGPSPKKKKKKPDLLSIYLDLTFLYSMV